MQQRGRERERERKMVDCTFVAGGHWLDTELLLFFRTPQAVLLPTLNWHWQSNKKAYSSIWQHYIVWLHNTIYRVRHLWTGDREKIKIKNREREAWLISFFLSLYFEVQSFSFSFLFFSSSILFPYFILLWRP